MGGPVYPARPVARAAVFAALLLGTTACSEAADSTAGTDPSPVLGPVAGNGAPAPTDGTPGPAPTTTPDTTTDGMVVNPTAVGGTSVPCDVASVVASNCHTCHGPTPVGGAIKLVTHEDWHRASPIYGPTKLQDASKLVYEVAQIRINNGEMPQGRQMPAEDLAILDQWLLAGAVSGTDADASCPAAPVDDTNTPVDQGDPDDGALGGMATGNGSECESDPTAYQPLTALPGETCYEFPVHGVSSPTDTSKFTVNPGESYHEWIYDVPWAAGDIATRFGQDFDNQQVLHHWLMFDYTTGQAHGTVNQNVLGTTLGANAQLLAGWAVGGCNLVLPDDVGLELPAGQSKIMVQWHMYNSTGVPQQDGTRVQICTVPAGSRPNVGGLTWLGTENITSPPGEHSFSGTCINDSAGPITIIGFLPHMHNIGVHMKSEVNYGGAGYQTVFDKPFQFDYQVHYMMDPPIVMQPNDVIRSTCTFFNNTGATVAFGQSSDQEMCYQFAFSYPAGALDNGVLSLIGATNVCWQFGE